MKRPIAYFAGTGRGVPVHGLQERRFSRRSASTPPTSGSSSGRASSSATSRAPRARTDLAAKASCAAMDKAGVHAGELDIIVLATASPDRLLPCAAVDLQAALGAGRAAAFDIGAACSGFIYSATVAESMIAVRQRRHGARHRRRKAQRASWTGRTARRACCSATAPARRCSSARRAAQGHSLVVPAQRRHARRSAVPSVGRRRRPVRRIGARRPLAVHQDERPRGVQERGAIDVRSGDARARRREAHRRRHRPDDSASGERPHHRSDGEARRHPDGQGLRERRPLREHVRRVGADRARRSDREGRRRRGLDRAARRVRRRVHVGLDGRPLSRRTSNHGRRASLSGPGLAEARHGQGSRRRFPGRARGLRARRRRARRARSAAVLRGAGRRAHAHPQRAAGAARRTAPPCGPRRATRSAHR